MLRKQEAWRPASVATDPALASLPLVLRRAHAFAAVLAGMPIEIDGDELIVGRTAERGVIVRTVLPEYALPEEATRARAEGQGITASLSHKTPDYDTLMATGLRGILDDIASKVAEISARPDSAEKTTKLLFMESMRIELEAVIGLARRFADLAETKALLAERPERAADLRRIAAVCRRVPEFAPRTFHEAVQSLWLVHYPFFSTRTGLALGRIDQYLWPLMEADLAAGRITREQARELVYCLWLKFNDRAQIDRDNYNARGYEDQPWDAGYRKRTILGTDRADAINHFGQNVLIGGIRPDGEDGTNELTYMCLDALEGFEFTSPVVTLRLHRSSPPALVRRCAEVLKSGGGMPYINNDDALIAGYERIGVPSEDARDYSNSNCWETTIAGKTDQEIIRGINFLLVLEWALNRGITRRRDTLEGIDTGDPLGFATFDDLMAAWKSQLDTLLSRNVDYIGSRYHTGELFHSGHGRYAHNPLLSALIRDCVANETDAIRGGARYVTWIVMAEAVANCADALAAIKRLVYDTRTVPMATVLDALAKNWEGYEALRQQMIARAPKFANDDDYADSIASETMVWFVERTKLHAQRYPKLIFPTGVGTFSWYASVGLEVGASCDGRHAWEPVAGNCSPTFGMDLNGPTSAIKSYSKLPTSDLPGGAPMDLRFSGSQLRGEAGTDRLSAFLRAFVALGGTMMTITVTDVEMLKAAMLEPMKYRGLRVRMGGWSAYFIALSREAQLLHIAKVEHGLG
jgi:choline trimethylamine-lyase